MPPVLGLSCCPSPTHAPRPDGVEADILLVHYTGMPDGKAALERLCDPAAQVSAHYLVDEDGTVVALVPEDRRAWHGGAGLWQGGRANKNPAVRGGMVEP